MKSSVTVSLVPEAKGGPFIFWDDLEGACRQAAELGFDAIEVFPPGAEALQGLNLGPMLREHGLKLAALGSGAGWVKHKLSLSSGEDELRRKALDFVKRLIDGAGGLGANVIVGSMQGKAEGAAGREEALKWLAESLGELGNYSRPKGVTVLYEFLNRYETNLLNRVEDVIPFMRGPGEAGVMVLADLFHMNIEEANVADALQQLEGLLGHVHFVDSNRRPAGCGHTDFAPIIQALREIGYTGYLSAEAFPYPDSNAAAARTIRSFRQFAAASSSALRA